jgi:hypothetical protein
MYSLYDAREAWANVQQGNETLGIDFGLDKWHEYISDWTTSIKSLGTIIKEEELAQGIIDTFAPFMDSTAAYNDAVNSPADNTSDIEGKLSNFSKLFFTTNVPVAIGDSISQLINEDGDVAFGTVYDVKDNVVVLWPSSANQDWSTPVLFTTLPTFPVSIAGTEYRISSIIDAVRNKAEIDELVATASFGLGNIQDDFVNDYPLLKAEIDKIPPLLRQASVAMSYKDSPMLQSPGTNTTIGQLAQVESDDPADFAKKVMGEEGKAALNSVKGAWDSLVAHFNYNTGNVAPQDGTSEFTSTVNTLEGYLIA